MIELNIKYNTTCPVCGEELVIIDNYITMICPKCHSTVFKELNNVTHTIKNGIMEDGYDASLDIVYKQFITYSLYAKSLTKNQYEEFWLEKKMLGLFSNEDIFAEGIYNYYVDKIKDFKMRQPCIYFDGYEKYLEMSKPDANNFKKKYINSQRR